MTLSGKKKGAARNSLILCCVLFLLMPLVFPLMSFAASGYGFSGLIELTYKKDIFKDPIADSSNTSFIQQYKLQYRSFIYNPKMVTYSIGGLFSKEDTDTEGARYVGGRAVNTKKMDYNFMIEALKGSRYPFTIYKDRFESPSWTIQPDLSVLTKQEIDKYGLFGNVLNINVLNQKGINLRYDFHQDSIKTTGLINEDRLNRSYLIGADKRSANEIIDISSNYQNNEDRITHDIEKIVDHKVFVWLKPSSVLDIMVDTESNDNSLTQLNNLSTVVKLYYVPSGNFNSNISIYGNKLKNTKDINDTTQFETGVANSTLHDK